MKGIKTLLGVVLSAMVFAASAQEQGTRTVPSRVTEATVFFNGAELTHTAAATITRGENSLAIEGLSPDIDLTA